MRLLFTGESAHTWGDQHRNGKIRRYLQLDDFKNLKRHHIKHQFDLFTMEVVARLALGGRFSQATSDMEQSMCVDQKDELILSQHFVSCGHGSHVCHP